MRRPGNGSSKPASRAAAFRKLCKVRLRWPPWSPRSDGGDSLFGGGDDDTFVFRRGQAAGDTVIDFAGNGAAAGDTLQFIGYGPGASFTQIDATHWQINSGDGLTHETITFQNCAAVHASDVLLV